MLREKVHCQQCCAMPGVAGSECDTTKKVDDNCYKITSGPPDYLLAGQQRRRETLMLVFTDSKVRPVTRTLHWNRKQPPSNHPAPGLGVKCTKIHEDAAHTCTQMLYTKSGRSLWQITSPRWEPTSLTARRLGDNPSRTPPLSNFRHCSRPSC